ncbi:MAG: hypothetical protein QOJ16_3701, partial [Acidobacteriota bacterium]|nr:hypothetical protein [Acidobacteriota bacterium]
MLRSLHEADPPIGGRVGAALTFLEILEEWARLRPEETIYSFLDSAGQEAASLRFGELDRRARAVAATLQERGSAGVRGARALLLYPPGLDFIVAFLGCLYAGVVAVPAYPPRPNRGLSRLRSIAADAGASFILTTVVARPGIEAAARESLELANVLILSTDELPAGAEAGWREVRPESGDPAFLQYTSGSTADPKGVIVTHGNLAHNEEMMRQAFAQSEASVVVGWLPLYHDMGLIGNVLQPLYLGARAILMSPLTFLQRPVRWLEAISRYRGTTSGGPNFAYDLCVRKISEAERRNLDLRSWTLAFNGAEPVRRATLDRFAAAFAPRGFSSRAFYPCYGLAEATLFVTGPAPGARKDVEGARGLVGCGRPWSGQRVVIVDPDSGVPRPPDQEGEIWIAGPSVAAGYWNRPEETARTFGARLAGSGEGPFLRTGDLGFLAGPAGGDLFVTGRSKDLIILRGRNLYPQDVELTAEGAHPALRPGCGAAFAVERAGEERLVIVHEVERQAATAGASALETIAQAVRRAVAEEHEAAVEEVVLLRGGTIPKTSSGKIRRHACREGYLNGGLTVVGRSRLAAGEPGEAADAGDVAGLEGLAGLGPGARAAAVQGFVASEAARALGIGRGLLAPDSPLTGLGLDSLAAVELKAGVEAKTGVSLSLTRLLAGASLAAVAAEVLAGLAGGAAVPLEASAIEPGAPLGEHPLSVGQEALWFVDRLAPEAAAYNLAAAARIAGDLDSAALGRAFQALADRHPTLRTTFTSRDGEPRQIVHPRLAVDFRVEPAREVAEVPEIPLAAEAFRPFDLETGPLLRIRVWPLSTGGGLLLLAVHHLVTDLWSLGLLVRELQALYGEETGRGPAGLAPLALGYTDHVRWQARSLAGEGGERLWDYWRRQLAGELPVLGLATDRPRPAVSTYAGLSRGLRLPAELADALRAASRASGTTLFVTLLSGLQALLARYTGQDELLIGSPTAGREAAPFRGVMGYFVNPVALRLTAAGDPTWNELQVAAREVSLAAFEHRELPFALVAERLRPERDPGRSPVFQALFAFQKAQRPEERGLAEFALGEEGAQVALGDLQLASVPLGDSRALFDLTLTMADVAYAADAADAADTADGGPAAGLPASLQLNRDLFDPATAERMLGHFANLLRALVADPSARVSAAELLSAAERAELAAWNRTDAELPRGLSLPDLLAAQVERTPGREALVSGAERLTYSELDRRAGLLARRLRALGVGPEVRVGVAAGRSAELVVALLAVLQAGGAYVPLDPVQPAERLAWMLADSGATLLLAEERLAEDLRAAGVPEGCRVVLLDVLAGAPEAPDGRDPMDQEVEAGLRPRPENLAYLIYTSGSTGRPKGVAIEHRSVVALVLWARQVFSDEELSGVLAATSIGFDLSVFELFVPLAWGGRVILVENVLALPGLANAAELRLVNTVPSVLAELLRGDEGAKRLPGTVRTVNLAGEPLPLGLAREIHRGRPAVRVLNLYGPSEDTTYSTFAVVPRESEGAPGIGLPIANSQAHLFDREMRPVPVGVPGELHLGGAGLARGYHGRPELTAERFLPDPFRPGARLYRTGDLARRRPNGELDFLGRIDRQVKIRGVRIEPAEVEAALLSLPGVREAAVLVQGEETAGRSLAAYVVPVAGADLDAGALRRALGQLLPRAMVPSAIVLLPGLPTTPNGKLDRRALARLAPATRTGEGGESGLLQPLPPITELLAGIWAEALGVLRVEAGDDFFALGGHSLLALRVQARVRERLGAELPLAAFFQLPTLEAQARSLSVRAAQAGQTPEGRRERPPLRPSGLERTVFPLSFAQERLWLLERLEPGTAAYHMAGAAQLTGPLDVAALGRALAEVVRRHDALRTHFREVDGAPVQEIAPGEAAAVSLPRVCLAGLPAALREAEAERLSRAAARRPFALASEPPLRLLLVRLAPESHQLVLVLHHIAADETSLALLERELAALYGAFAAGFPSPLPEPPLRAADFALWQREWLRGEALEAELAWWRQRLADLPVASIAELPADRPRPAVRSGRGSTVTAPVPHALAAALAALGLREGATLFMVLLAAFHVVLERTSGEPEVPVGCPVSSRDREPLFGLIGFFVNTLVLRASGAGAPSFRGLLRQVRQATVEAYEHGEVPFELVVEALRPDRVRGRNPLFEVAFALQRPPRGWRSDGLDFVSRTLSTGTAKFDLTLLAADGDGDLALSLEYATDLFDRPTAARFLAHLETLLAAAVEDPARALAELPLLSPAELQQVREWGAGEAVEAGASQVHALFERQAERGPDVVAVCGAVSGEGGALTYGELDRRANRLARHLRRRGVGPEVPVAIWLPRSPAEVTAALAVLKAGGAYVPFDPAIPEERLASMLAGSGIPILITREGAAASLRFTGVEVCLSGVDAAAIAREDGGSLGIEIAPESLAYAIFTSGSTGTPKGVMISHESLANLVSWHLEAYGVRPSDRASRVAGLGFDAAVWELWPYLAAGASLELPAEPVRTSPPALADWLVARQITLCFLPTPLAEAVLSLEASLEASLDEPLAGSPLRFLLTGGDRLRQGPRETAAWRLVNHYGPSESTVVATSAPVLAGEGAEAAGAPPIGRPIANVSARVLDRDLRPVAAGVPGELYLGGAGLARGYLGRPELTAERFLPDSGGPAGPPGARLYRTGDRVQLRTDGQLDFLGRVDEQLKIQGFRIEPAEIEAALSRHPGIGDVARVAVRAWERGQGGFQLAAYFVPRGAEVPGEAELRAFLRRLLPEPMVPASFTVLAALPFSANGKLDRRRLPAPELGEDPRDLVAPRTPTEELLAEIWAGVLGRERVGVRDDFFAAGGHSLAAARVVARIEEALGVSLPLSALFTHSTVAELAAEVDRARGGMAGQAILAAPPLVPSPGEIGEAPLSFSQERLWFLDQLEPGSPVYNLAATVRLDGALDPTALRRALADVVARQAALRTTLRSIQGRTVQIVAASRVPALPEVDLAALPSGIRNAEAERLTAVEALVPFDLSRGPLFRATLLRLTGEEHRLLLTFHHIVTDGWSLRLFFDELAAFYGGARALPALPVQYADYARWQREHLSGAVLDRQVAYWRQRLTGIPAALHLPFDRPRPAVQTYHGLTRHLALDPSAMPSLRAFARGESATLFMTLLAAFAALLHRYTWQPDMVLGTPTANRSRVELEPLIGFFANSLALRVDLAGDPTFRELLGRVRGSVLADYAHQEVPFEKVVEELRPERDLSHHPLYQVAFALEDSTWRDRLALPGLRLAALPAAEGTAKYDLALYMDERGSGLTGILEANRDLFDPATGVRWLGHFAILLAALTRDPARRLSELPLLGLAERHQLLVEANDTRREPGPGSWEPFVHRRFEARAAARPEAPAVSQVGKTGSPETAGEAGRSLTYGELNRRANQLAHRLR